METVAGVVDVVAHDLGRIGEREVDTVPDVEDLVVDDSVMRRVPEVDPVAAIGLDEVEPPLDAITDDFGPVSRLDIDPVQ